MRESLAVIVLALSVAACAAPDPVLQPEPGVTVMEDGMSHDGAMGDEHGDHDHGDAQSMEWDGGAAPEISIEVTGDNERGWTVSTSITNYTLADMTAADHVPGEGHAHIWLDGQVITMISEPTVVIPTLDPGTHEIIVTLSSNTHMEYTRGGERLMARTTIEVEGTVSDHPVITIAIADGVVSVDDERPRVSLGDQVELRITADVADEVHVHGYDAMGALEPGIETIVRFTADIPGIFEVELESAGTHLLDLQVG